MLEITTSWQEKERLEGLREGRQEGQVALILLLLTKKFGLLSEDLATRIKGLDSKHLTALGEAILDFTSIEEVNGWLRGVD